MRAVTFIGTTLLALAPAVLDAAQDRARTLHDTYCLACHGTQTYTRADRIVTDYGGLRTEVDRWQRNMSLNWSRADIDIVTAHLAERYYKLACPAPC